MGKKGAANIFEIWKNEGEKRTAQDFEYSPEKLDLSLTNDCFDKSKR